MRRVQLSRLASGHAASTRAARASERRAEGDTATGTGTAGSGRRRAGYGLFRYQAMICGRSGSDKRTNYRYEIWGTLGTQRRTTRFVPVLVQIFCTYR
jgi:hypothetical protein